jgi:hypothetical protein
MRKFVSLRDLRNGGVIDADHLPKAVNSQHLQYITPETVISNQLKATKRKK